MVQSQEVEQMKWLLLDISGFQLGGLPGSLQSVTATGVQGKTWRKKGGEADAPADTDGWTNMTLNALLLLA